MLAIILQLMLLAVALLKSAGCAGLTSAGNSSPTPPPSSNLVSVKDARFGAKGDLRTCEDMQTTIGSTTVTSPAECQFTQADVNKWVQVPKAGDDFGTGLSAQIVSVQDAQHVTLSAAAGATVGSAQIIYDDLIIKTSSYTVIVSSVQHPFTPDLVGAHLTITGGTGFTPATVTIQSVDYAGLATVSAAIGTQGSAGGTGTATLWGTIATGDYAALSEVATFACKHPNSTILYPPGTYYIESYRIDAGGAANHVRDITWTNCHDITISGYGAAISSNGSFRRTADNGVYSYENSVSPFRFVGAASVVVQGIELNGNVDKMTRGVNVVEGQDYGLITTNSQNVMIRDVNSHHWPTDGLILGLLSATLTNAADRNDQIDSVWSHNNGRMGLTLSNINGLNSVNYRCSQIGAPFTGGYGGHPPQDCVDIEPPIAADVKTGNILFSGGYMTSAFGGTLAVTAGCCSDLTVDGVVFDDGPNMNFGRGGGAFAIGFAARTVIKNSTFYTQKLHGFGCGQPYFVAALERADIVGNRFILQSIPEILCGSNDGSLRPIHFVGNHIIVKGGAVQNGVINLSHMEEVAGNDFFISGSAKFPNLQTAISYDSTQSVHDNTYNTDLTNASSPYTVSYTNVRLWRNELSLNPTYFVVIPNGP